MTAPFLVPCRLLVSFPFSPPSQARPPRPPRYLSHQWPPKLTSIFEAPDVEISETELGVLQWSSGLDRWWGRHRSTWSRAARRATWWCPRWRRGSFVVRVGGLERWREREEWLGCGSCGRGGECCGGGDSFLAQIMVSCNLYGVAVPVVSLI